MLDLENTVAVLSDEALVRAASPGVTRLLLSVHRAMFLQRRISFIIPNEF